MDLGQAFQSKHCYKADAEPCIRGTARRATASSDQECMRGDLSPHELLVMWSKRIAAFSRSCDPVELHRAYKTTPASMLEAVVSSVVNKQGRGRSGQRHAGQRLHDLGSSTCLPTGVTTRCRDTISCAAVRADSLRKH